MLRKVPTLVGLLPIPKERPTPLMLDMDASSPRYVMVDDFHKSVRQGSGGPDASLSDSEAITLAIFSPFLSHSPANR